MPAKLPRIALSSNLKSSEDIAGLGLSISMGLHNALAAIVDKRESSAIFDGVNDLIVT